MSRRHKRQLNHALRGWAFHVALCILTLASIARGAEDHTEITVELNAIWQSQSMTNHHRLTATCIVGSDSWFLSGDFLKNARVEYWHIGKNLVEHRVITSNPDESQESVSKDSGGNGRFAFAHPRIGETSITVFPSPSGEPVFNGMEGVLWLAFCSGQYLKQPDRQIPMLIGPSSLAFGFADQTVLFEGGDLPKSVKLFATNGTVVCDYEVLAATNYLGRTFPVQFRVMQRGQPANGAVRGNSRTDLEGKVISIRSVKPREVPEDIRKKLEP